MDTTSTRSSILQGRELNILRAVGSMGAPRFVPKCTNQGFPLVNGTATNPWQEREILLDTGSPVTTQVNPRLCFLRNGVVAALLVSSSQLLSGESTALELPVIGQECMASQGDLDQEPSDNFLEPLVFQWSEDDFVASQAVRAFCAELYADP